MNRKVFREEELETREGTLLPLPVVGDGDVYQQPMVKLKFLIIVISENCGDLYERKIIFIGQAVVGLTLAIIREQKNLVADKECLVMQRARKFE